MAVCFSILPLASSTDNETPAQRPFFKSICVAFSPLKLGSFLLFLLLLMASTSFAGVLRPLDGTGNFHSYFDVVNRWQNNGKLDVLVLVEVANADIKYEKSGKSFIGKLNFEISIEGPDGDVISKKRHMSTPALDEVASSSRTASQVFGMVLENVPMRSGRLTCRLYDAIGRKRGIANRSSLPVSESVFPWSAEQEVRSNGGVTVGDPLFLANAPLKTWNPDQSLHAAKAGYLHDYIHPSRRYGLEEDTLQLFIPVWPSVGLGDKGEEHSGLQVQIMSEDMVYTIVDTITFSDRGVNALESGRPAAILYELDLNILPEGTYRMGLAPLNKQGKGQLLMFDVVWRLGALGVRRDEILGEGRMVFVGKELDHFLSTNPSGQEKLLAEFWEALNPNSEDPVNSVYLEFLYRKQYVRNFLGGFGAGGAIDPRGEVFLLLGQPDDVERNAIPMSSDDLSDAQIKTYQQFAPDREGAWAKGDAGYAGSQGATATAAIPMPYSENAEKQYMLSLNSSYKSHGYELWKYDSGGEPLFDNYLMAKGSWQRFLFVDRTGSGDYFLESTNALYGED